MSGITLAFAGGSFAPSVPTVIGQAFGGGYYAGQIGVSSVATYYIIVGPVASAQLNSAIWKNAQTATAGADSNVDGPQNTADMVADGNSTVYPSAHFCNNLVVGGFSDWYMPAQNELEICYYNLKPTTTANNTSSGINPNAVPARASNYTSVTPAQTSVADFQSTGAEDFLISSAYWSSTEGSATGGRYIFFQTGYQRTYNKEFSARARAVRRIPV
jgi:hypothetical protein